MRDIDGIKNLVEGRKDLATTLLERAFVAEDKEIFVMLLEMGANPDKVSIHTKWGPEPLFMPVAGHDDSFWTEQILKHGANPNQQYTANRIYPLTFAIERHKPNNVRLLIEHGADVNSRDQDCSQIDLSWSQWQHEITYDLLTHGADVNAPAQLLKSMIGQMRFDFRDKADSRVISRAKELGTFDYLEKILAWFDEHNLDWRNATHSDPTGKTPGVWSIPKLNP